MIDEPQVNVVEVIVGRKTSPTDEPDTRSGKVDPGDDSGINMSNYYTKSEVNRLINSIDTSEYLPGDNITISSDKVISAVDTKYTAADFDIKDLKDSTYLRYKWNNKQDALTPGDNITIDSNKVISAVDTKYTATDFDISELSDTNTKRQYWDNKQDKLIAGNNIKIVNNVISTDPEVDDSIDSDTTTWSSNKIKNIISNLDSLVRIVVTELPTTDINPNAIYLVPSADAEENNSMDEYMYINNEWEKIGDTKTDLSDYYNKTQVDTFLDRKQNKITGSNGEVVYHNGNNVFTQSVMNEGWVVDTDIDLSKCINQSPSFEEVFNTWKRFSILNNTDNAKPTETTAWVYNSSTDTILQPLNSESYVGFVSPSSYSSYDITIKCSSNGDDNDAIGLVAAYAKDPLNGKIHTLSFIRTPSPGDTQSGNMGKNWFAILDFDQFNPTLNTYGQKILVDNSSTANTNSGKKWNQITNGTTINMHRDGNIITAKCSQFGSTTIDDSTLITIDLDDLSTSNPLLNLFKGSSPWGYSNFSQPNSTYTNISVTDPNSTIYDFVNNQVLIYDNSSSSWVPTGSNPLTELGAGRFSYNNVTKKLFYNNGSKVIELSQNEELDLATVATTGSYNDLIDKPTIPTKTSQLTNDSGFINTVDSTLSDSSTNPVQNKVITDAISNKQDKLSTSGTNVHLVDNVLSVDDNSIVYKQGKGIEINEDNEISIVQNDEVIETPVTDDREANVFYNYNGVKVVVPRGNGYFNLLNNYIVPDADGNQLFPKGLYIQDDTRSISEVDAYIYELWASIDKSSYILEFNEDLVAEVIEAGYTTTSSAEDMIRSTLSSYFNNNLSNSINAKVNYECIFSKFSIAGEYDPLLLRIPLSSRVFNSGYNYRYYHNEVPSNLQIIRKGDYFYDVLGNLYTVSSASFNPNGSSSNYLTTNFSGILSKKTTDSFSITLEEVSSVTTDTIVNIINGYVGEEIVKVKFPTTVSAIAKLSYFQSDYSDNPTYRKPYRVTYHFKGFYKNSNDQYCYVYGPSESETVNIAMTKRVTQLQNHNTDGEHTKQPTFTFCGFLTFGTPYSIELPIQYTTDDSEIQGFSWTDKKTSIDDILSDTSINAVQNKVITNEITKIRTEFVPHYIELPSDGIKGDIVQYIGYTDNYFTNGYFYKYDNIIIPPNTNYISLNNDYPKFKRGVYTEIESPTNFPSLGVVQVISTNFYGDYTIAEGQDEYGTLFNFPSNRFDFFGVPDKTDRVELMKGLDYIQVGELAADEAGNLYRISEVDTNSRYPNPIKVKLEIYRLAYDFTLKRNSEPDVTYKLSNVLSQILSETWISIRLDDGTSIQYSLFKTFANYRGDTIYAYKYSSGTSMTGPIYCCSTKLVNGVVRPTFAGFLYWSNWVQTIYIETGSLTIKPQIYTSGDTSVTSDHLGWNQIDVQPNSGGGVISYNDLIDKPTIPTKTSQLTNDSGFSTFSGSYNDLTDKPTIPQVDDALSDDSSNAVENRVIKSAIDDKITNGGGVTTEMALTKAEYNSIPTKDDNTVYIITDEPIDGSNVFKVCIVGQNTTNISDLIQPYSLIPNNVVILTDLDDSKTYEYTLNDATKTFRGDSEHDLMFRYIGNNEFKPIVFGLS